MLLFHCDNFPGEQITKLPTGYRPAIVSAGNASCKKEHKDICRQETSQAVVGWAEKSTLFFFQEMPLGHPMDKSWDLCFLRNSIRTRLKKEGEGKSPWLVSLNKCRNFSLSLCWESLEKVEVWSERKEKKKRRSRAAPPYCGFRSSCRSVERRACSCVSF